MKPSLNKKQLQKGTLVLASAVLVSSVIAPTLSAEANTKVFSDVTNANVHKPNIDALVTRGIINGYPNGTFQPWKTLSRSDVVKMLGRFLMENGQAVPADYRTKMRYNDLTVNSSEELLRYAAVVKEAGVFNGDPNGNLNPFGNMTRQNISLVLIRTLAFITDMTEQEVIAFTEARNPNITLADLAQANAESRPYIKALKYFNVTNVDNYRPRESTNRAQYASFLNRMFMQVLENNATLQQLELYKDSLRAVTIVISPDGKEATGKDLTPGRTVIIYNAAGQEIGRGVVGADGTYKITFTSAVNPGDRIRIVVDIDGNPATTNDQISIDYTVPATTGGGVATPQQVAALKALHDSVRYVAVSPDGKTVPRTEKWTTAAEKYPLEVAVANAKTIVEKTAPTVAEVTAATNALTAAITTYTAAQKNGLLTADKAGLKALLDAVKYVAVSTDGKDIGSVDKWTTAAEKRLLEDAVAAANVVMQNPNASEQAIIDAQRNLLNAWVAYEAAQKYGMKPADKASLQAAIDSIQYVAVSTDGKDIHPSNFWTTQAEKTALDNAVVAAREVLLNASATDVQIANAQGALLDAVALYKKAYKPGLLEVALAPTFSTLALKSEAPGDPSQYSGITDGTSISFAAVGVNLIDEDIISWELLGTNGLISAPTFTVPQGNTLSFSATLTNSSVLALGELNLLVLKGVEETKNAAGQYTQYQNVARDSAYFLSALGIPLQTGYNFTFDGLDGGTYLLAAAPSGGLGLGVIGGMALRVNSVEYTDRQDSINAALVATPITGNVTLPTATTMVTNVRAGSTSQPVTLQQAGVIQGQYGTLTMNSNGSYSYKSAGKVSSVGKVDTFEVTTNSGEKGYIYIRTNLLDAQGVTQTLNWSDANPTQSAPIVMAKRNEGTVTLTPPATYKENYVISTGAIRFATGSNTYNSPVPTAQQIQNDSQRNFVKGSDSYLTFEPYTSLRSSIVYRVIKIDDLETGSGTTVYESTHSFQGNHGPISLTGLPRGYYRIEAQSPSDSSRLLTYGLNRFKTYNLTWATTNITNQKFVTTDYNEAQTSNIGYMINGSDIYINNQKITTVRNNSNSGTVIRGKYGTLTAFADGKYNYAPDTTFDSVGKSEVFEYTIVGPNGDESVSTIEIKLDGNANFSNPILTDGDVRNSGTRIYRYEGKPINPATTTSYNGGLQYTVGNVATSATVDFDSQS